VFLGLGYSLRIWPHYSVRCNTLILTSADPEYITSTHTSSGSNVNFSKNIIFIFLQTIQKLSNARVFNYYWEHAIITERVDKRHVDIGIWKFIDIKYESK